MACVEVGCSRPIKVRARGLCNMHYVRAQRANALPPLERFWPKVAKAEDGQCWEWLGNRNKDGYGTYGGRPAHRLAYERAYGVTVSADLHIDHLCRNHGCCNPGHLRPRDPHANMSDNGRRDRLGCKNGHLWSAENTRWRTRKGRTHRVCRACDRYRQAKYKAKGKP